MPRETPYLPLSNGTNSPPPNIRRSIFYKRVGTKVVAGLAAAGLLYMLAYTLTRSPIKSTIPQLITAPPKEKIHIDYKETEPVLDSSEYLAPKQVRSIVGKTKGYFSKDWSLYLGAFSIHQFCPLSIRI